MTVLEIAKQYPAKKLADLDELDAHYSEAREDQLMSIAAEACKVNAGTLMLALQGKPRYEAMADAFAFWFPGIEPEKVLAMKPAQLTNMALQLRPTYFESLVYDRLNAGEQVADVVLPEGCRCTWKRRRDAPWNLVVRDADNEINTPLTRWAERNLSYIRRALADHPDLIIDEDLDKAEDISNDLFKELVDFEGQVVERGLQHGAMAAGSMSGVAAFGGVLVPIIPAALLLITEGQTILTGRSGYEHAATTFASRFGRAAVFSTLGALTIAWDFGLLTGPICATARASWMRMENRKMMQRYVAPRIQALEDVAVAYKLPKVTWTQ